MPPFHKQAKSPLIFLTIITALVIATLLVISLYFFKPNIESELKNKLTKKFLTIGILHARINVSGRDVTLTGVVSGKSDIEKAISITKNTYGVHKVNNKLMIRNQINGQVTSTLADRPPSNADK